jgi:hypothetical protein
MSPIPLGILAASGALLFRSDFDLLQTEILTGSQASVTFSDLNSTYGSIYQHLQIRMVGNGNEATLRFNGVTTSGSYKDHRLFGLNGSVSSGTVYTDKILLGAMGVDTDQFAATVVDILDPFSTDKNTTIRALSGRPRASNAIVQLISGLFISTNAITSIEISDSVNFTTGSRFSLYGLKASV